MDAITLRSRLLIKNDFHKIPLFQAFEGNMCNITKCFKCGKKTRETNNFISILLSIDVGNDETYDVVGRRIMPVI